MKVNSETIFLIYIYLWVDPRHFSYYLITIIIIFFECVKYNFVKLGPFFTKPYSPEEKNNKRSRMFDIYLHSRVQLHWSPLSS